MARLRVLVACEFSGIVRDAFIARGHNAVSCDLLPSERPGPHIQGDVLAVLNLDWDLIVAHPECRYLNHAGVRWLYQGGRRWNKDGSENPRDPAILEGLRECDFNVSAIADMVVSEGAEAVSLINVLQVAIGNAIGHFQEEQGGAVKNAVAALAAAQE